MQHTHQFNASSKRFVKELLKRHRNILLKLHLNHIRSNETIISRLWSKNEEVYTQVNLRAIPSALQQTFSGYWGKGKEIQTVIFLIKQHVGCKLLGKEYSHSSLTIKCLLQTVQQSYCTLWKPIWTVHIRAASLFHYDRSSGSSWSSETS